MSINRAQAKLLATDFLNTIGSSDDELAPVETVSELIVIAAELIEAMQTNLEKGNNVASGSLSSSIEAEEPQAKGRTLSINILMNFYGKFLNSGVKGTKDGEGLYQFKYGMPSAKMVKAIADWMKSRGMKTTSAKPIFKSEVKNKQISELQSAFAVARSIKQHGIKPTGFIDKAVEDISAVVEDRLGMQLQVDIIDHLKK